MIGWPLEHILSEIATGSGIHKIMRDGLPGFGRLAVTGLAEHGDRDPQRRGDCWRERVADLPVSHSLEPAECPGVRQALQLRHYHNGEPGQLADWMAGGGRVVGDATPVDAESFSMPGVPGSSPGQVCRAWRG